jgi:hypothetical protein
MLRRELEPWRSSSSHSFSFAQVKLAELGLESAAAATKAAAYPMLLDGPSAMELDDDGEERKAHDRSHSAAAAAAAASCSPSISCALEAECQARVQPEYAPSWLECTPPLIAHPFASSAPSPPAHVWLNEHTGVISARPPAQMESLDEVRGGILADEMGLGKTVSRRHPSNNCCASVL